MMAMYSKKNGCPCNEKSDAEITDDMYPYLRRYKDGHIERLMASALVPASVTPGATGVATRDVVIDPCTGVSVRLFLNVDAAATGKRLPLIVYFHGGSFCIGSAFFKMFHRYATSLSTRAGALVVSVDYRLAPEHPIPAAYEDAWMALQWVTTLSDPWLADHAAPERMFLAGESSGANIVHNMAVQAATEEGHGIGIEGLILLHPYFWGLNRLPSEMDFDDGAVLAPKRVDTLWPFVTGGTAGNDDPRLNPPASLIASLQCQRALVAVATKDVFWERGCRYAEILSHGQQCREVKFVESKGEDHGFHLYRPARASAIELMDNVADFINSSAPSSIVNTKTELFQRPMRPLHAQEATNKACKAAGENGGHRKDYGWFPGGVARNPLVVRHEKTPAGSFGLVIQGQSTPRKLSQMAPVALRRAVAQSARVVI